MFKFNQLSSNEAGIPQSLLSKFKNLDEHLNIQTDSFETKQCLMIKHIYHIQHHSSVYHLPMVVKIRYWLIIFFFFDLGYSSGASVTSKPEGGENLWVLGHLLHHYGNFAPYPLTYISVDPYYTAAVVQLRGPGPTGPTHSQCKSRPGPSKVMTTVALSQCLHRHPRHRRWSQVALKVGADPVPLFPPSHASRASTPRRLAFLLRAMCGCVSDNGKRTYMLKLSWWSCSINFWPAQTLLLIPSFACFGTHVF